MSKQITPREQIKNGLQQMAPELKRALPSHVSVEKFMRVAQTAITTTPALMSCDRTSLWAAVTKAAQVGLMPDGREAAIVPFKDKCQFMSMISGKMKLARNSGEIKSLDSQVVYENDDFKYWIDEEGPHIRHIPNIETERGEIKCAYAVGITKDGGIYIELMTKEQLSDVEKSSRGKNTPWNGPFRSEMQRKSVMNRLLKRMPTSTDIDMDIDNDHSFSDINPDPEPQPEVVEEKTVEPKNPDAPNKLLESMQAQNEEAPI